MTNIPANFPKNRELSKCVCGQPENMTHIYECKILNSDEQKTQYKKFTLGSQAKKRKKRYGCTNLFHMINDKHKHISQS